MKKIYALIIAVLLVGNMGVAYAAFPQTFTNWVSGNIITSDWLNRVEQSITGTSTNVAVINGLATTTGNIIVASSSSGWKILAVGANGTVLTASSSNPLGIAWGPSGSGITTSTWVITASGTNMFANNQGGSSTIWIITNPTFANITNSALASALITTNGSGLMANYGGATTCLGNGAFVGLSALGASTCSSNVGVSTSTSQLWLALQQFIGIASTTQFYSASSTLNGQTQIAGINFTNATGTNLTITKAVDQTGNAYSTSTLPVASWSFGNEVPNQIGTLLTFDATTTVKRVYAGNFIGGAGNASGSITFNLGFTTSTSNATSTWERLFLADQTVNSLGSSTLLSLTGSTTWGGVNIGGLPWILGYFTEGNASSSEFDGWIY